MKRVFYLFSFLIILVGFLVANYANAFGVTRKSFGGRIMSVNNIPGISTCVGQYWAVTIAPVGGIFPPTPYYIPITTKKLTNGAAVLGNYNQKTTSVACTTDTAPPAPISIPMFSIYPLNFGVSRR